MAQDPQTPLAQQLAVTGPSLTTVPTGVTVRDVVRERLTRDHQSLGMFGATPTTAPTVAGGAQQVGNPWQQIGSAFLPGAVFTCRYALGSWHAAAEEVMPWMVTLHPLRPFDPTLAGLPAAAVTDAWCEVVYGAGGTRNVVQVDWPQRGGSFVICTASVELSFNGTAGAVVQRQLPIGGAHLSPAMGAQVGNEMLQATRTVPYSAAPGGGTVTIAIPPMAQSYMYRPANFGPGQLSIQQRDSAGNAVGLDLYLVSTSLGTVSQTGRAYRLHPRAASLFMQNADAAITNSGGIIFPLAL